ncbi:MAG: DUF2512 family protein [Bacillota bacterium]
MEAFLLGLKKYVVFAAVSVVLLRNLVFIPLPATLLIALGAALASYIVADVAILPTWGNAAATAADFFVIWIVIWGAQLVWPVLNIGVLDAIFTAAVIAAAEWFFHQYLGRERLAVRDDDD